MHTQESHSSTHGDMQVVRYFSQCRLHRRTQIAALVRGPNHRKKLAWRGACCLEEKVEGPKHAETVRPAVLRQALPKHAGLVLDERVEAAARVRTLHQASTQCIVPRCVVQVEEAITVQRARRIAAVWFKQPRFMLLRIDKQRVGVRMKLVAGQLDRKPAVALSTLHGRRYAILYAAHHALGAAVRADIEVHLGAAELDDVKQQERARAKVGQLADVR